MARLRVHNLSVSLDGYAAGPDQSLAQPLGVDGERLHHWLFATRTFRQLVGEERDKTEGEQTGGDETGGDETGGDDEFVIAGETGIGATIMGRNMFGPVRGEWPDESWTGWWGPNPPFHHDVFVLTHHARRPVRMDGGTTFYFVTDGIEAALARAVEAAGGLDVRLGGGVATVQQYLRAGLVDELHVAIVPVLLGAGERLFDGGVGVPGYEVTRLVATPAVAHAVLTRV